MKQAEGVAGGLQSSIDRRPLQSPLEGETSGQGTREPPHVTVIRGTDAWRINLRTGEFMDAKPDPSDVPNEVIGLIKEEESWQRLCDE